MGDPPSPRAPVRRTSELDTLDRVLRADGAGNTAAAARLLRRLRRAETTTGRPLADVLDALEQAARRDATRTAGSLTAEQRSALASVGADFAARELIERPSVVTDLAYRRLIDRALATAEAAKLLRVTDGRIRQRVGAHTLLAVRVAGALRLPRFQFTDSGELPGWSHVAPAVPDTLPLVAVAAFMATPHIDLIVAGRPVTPADWLLADGHPGKIAELIVW